MSDHAARFRALHQGLGLLRLPNAWDAGSARLFESLGAPAVATTSAGVAWALGYRDARRLPIDEVIALVARMTRVLSVPLSVDIEHGYSDEPKQVAENVLRLVDLGVVGINIEDGSDAPALLARKVEAVRAAMAKHGADLFVNARCDVFLASLVPKDRQVEESLERGRLYERAGADGFFLPGVHRAEDIRALVDGVPLPLNVMDWAEMPSVGHLENLGVRRLSAGSAIAQAIWGQSAALARAFLDTGRLPVLGESPLPYGQLQSLFSE